MGWLCDQAVKAGHYAVADLLCPIPEARAAFGDAYTVYLDTGEPSPYPETRAMFVPPYKANYEIREQNAGFHAQKIVERLTAGTGGFDWRKPAALVIGRFAPFRACDKALVLEAINRVGQVCIAVCGTEDVDAKNPFGLMTIRDRIEIMLAGYLDKIAIIGLPHITSVMHGRDTAPVIDRIDLHASSNIRGGRFVETIYADKESAAA
jgi:hypothetical protein